MKMTKKVSIGGAYARKAPYEYEGVQYDADIKNGDSVKILNEGQNVAGQFGDQFVVAIETRNGEKNLTLNQKSINILIDEWGDDSKNWIGKEAKILTLKTVIAGKKVVVAYAVTGNWTLDDYGDLVKGGTESSTQEETVNLEDESIETPF